MLREVKGERMMEMPNEIWAYQEHYDNGDVADQGWMFRTQTKEVLDHVDLVKYVRAAKPVDVVALKNDYKRKVYEGNKELPASTVVWMQHTVETVINTLHAQGLLGVPEEKKKYLEAHHEITEAAIGLARVHLAHDQIQDAKRVLNNAVIKIEDADYRPFMKAAAQKEG